MIDAEFEARFEKMVQRLLDDDPGTRSAAAAGILASARRVGLHPADIRLRLSGSLGQFPLVELLRTEVNELFREADFLRRHADPGVLKAAIAAREVDYQWPEFEELIRTRITGDPVEARELSPGWKARVVRLLKVSPPTLGRWKDGRARIPERFFDELRQMPALRADEPAPPRRVHPPRPERDPAMDGRRTTHRYEYPWTPELYRQVLALLRQHNSDAAIKLAGLTRDVKGPFNRAFNNNGPDEQLLGYEIPIRESGPMDYFELWKIGHALWKATTKTGTWKGYITQRFGMPRNKILWDDPDWLTPAQCDELRQEFRALPATRPGPLRGALDRSDWEAIGSLWTEPDQIAATRRFVTTHVQQDWFRLTERDMELIRERYQSEIRCREQNVRFAHLSCGLALLPKRTVKQLPRDDKGTLSGEGLYAYAVQWFGSVKPHVFLAQLLGYDHTYIAELFHGKKVVTATLERLVRQIASLSEGIDLDDPAAVDRLRQRVRLDQEVPPETPEPWNRPAADASVNVSREPF